MEIHIAHLYPKLMSTYGDSGNIICLKKRCEWRGITPIIHNIDINDEIPPEVDLYFFGGGQDKAQKAVGIDLQTKKTRITQDINNGVPLLAICGGYQLCGIEYLPENDQPIPGISIFPVITKASKKRMIGNIVINLNKEISHEMNIKTVVGFENHSGETFIDKNPATESLGKVLLGYGNNGCDNQEGCHYKNAIGCYLHGPVLPKNPHLTDWLIEKAIKLTHSDYKIDSLPDEKEWQTHQQLVEKLLGISSK